MDRKTVYTRTFMELQELPIHDESVKTHYYTWWQNVRESYQARSLRLTKQGLRMLEKIDLKKKQMSSGVEYECELELREKLWLEPIIAE